MPETYTHDDNATTWRDLADALCPQQVASGTNEADVKQRPRDRDGANIA